MSIDVVDLRNFYAQRLGIGGAALRRPRHPHALDRHARPARARHRLCDALSRPVPRGGRALPRLHAGGAGRGEMADGAARARRRWSRRSNCRCRTPPSIACCSCMRWKCRTTRSRCCARSGACSRPAASCSRWCRTGAACGRAWTRRRSAMAGPIRARRSRICCARPGSRRSAGARRSMCRRSSAAGSCARRWRGSAPARRISAPFAGVHIVEATKQVYRAIPARREKRALVPALEPVLAPSPGGAARAMHSQ